MMGLDIRNWDRAFKMAMRALRTPPPIRMGKTLLMPEQQDDFQFRFGCDLDTQCAEGRILQCLCELGLRFWK